MDKNNLGVNMKKVKYNDNYIYIDDTLVDVKETGVLSPKEIIPEEEEFENTYEIEVVEDKMLEDTLTNLYGDLNE